MKKYDFIIVYEAKNREFDSVCLLKYELERRGHSVFVVETWSTIHRLYEPVYADVMFTFALYDDSQIAYTLSFAKGVKKIINMCWEQIFTNAEESADDSLHHIKGRAREQYHVAWGQHSVDWLMGMCTLPEERIIRAGHVAMDFAKPCFKNYYRGRDEILKEYGIDTAKKIILFVSSFSYVGLAETIMDTPGYESEVFSASAYQRLSVLSQNEVLKWLTEAAKMHSECEFIYRPHPAEASNIKLTEIEREISNFRVIKDLPVKQWMSVSDMVYSWYSTAIADAYFMKKDVGILRPVEIPYDMDVTLMNGCNFITSFESFENTLSKGIPAEEKLHEMMEYYYFFDEDIYSYIIIADKAEELLHTVKNSGCGELNSAFPVNQSSLRENIRRMRNRMISVLGRSHVIKALVKKLPPRYLKKFEFEAYVTEMIEKNAFTESEMHEVTQHIAQLLGNIVR